MTRGYWGTAVILVLFFSSLMGASLGPNGPDPPPQDPAPVGAVTAEPAPGPVIPVREPFFTENREQFGTWSARFYAQGGPWSVALGYGWIAYDLHTSRGMESDGGRVVRVTFSGANDVIPEGSGTLEHKYNYLHGPDPTGWVTGVPNHKYVVYTDLWDGIDLQFHFEKGEFKYEFIVAPGSDPSSIIMAYDGMDSLEVCQETGDLLVRAREVTLRDHAPVTYQTDSGQRVTVPSAFNLLGDDRVAFRLGDYDVGLPLVIDPGMIFSTFLGETGNDVGNDVAVDDDGYIYVTGRTTSAKFPVTPGAYDTVFNSSEAFVSKFSPNGTSLEYSTFIGGSDYEEATAVAVDNVGLVHLTGTTRSSDFPTTSGAFCTTLSGWSDAFALKLNVTGSSLDYSTFIGGSYAEKATAMDLDASGSLYVTGWTMSPNFPEVTGSFRKVWNLTDVFVVKLKPDGSDLEYSSVLGGEFSDNAYGLVVDDDGCAYITGSTTSEHYPTTPAAYDTFATTSKTIPDVFVTKLNATGGSLVYSTFIGDILNDTGMGIDVDAEGCAYVVGSTQSGRFPMHPPRPYPYDSRGGDSFILKLSTSGHRLVYSKVLNITHKDAALAVSVDPVGRAFVAGYVDGRGNFPTTPNAFQPKSYSEKREAYVLVVDEHGDTVPYSSFLGGNEEDSINAIAMDGDDLIYVTGHTFSTQGFPTTPGAYDNTSDASTVGDPVGDAFLCKMDISVPYLVNDTSNRTATTGETFTFNLTIADNIGVVEAGVQYWFGEEINSTNLTLVLTGGDERYGSWTGTIDVPSDSLAFLFYRAWANDTSGLNCTIRDYSILVLDNDLPSLMNLSPASAGTGNEFNLSARVVDNIAVDKVALLITTEGLLDLDPDGEYTTMSMTGKDGDVYNFTIILPWFNTDPLEYRFWANDTSGNWILSDVFELEVFDDDMPMLSFGPLPKDVTTGQELELRVYVRDYIGVSGVWFTWWFEGANSSDQVTLPMEDWSVDALGNGLYVIKFRVPKDIFTRPIPRIGLTFKATDTSNNTVESRVIWLNVFDNDPPSFLEDISSQEATTGDPFDIRVRVRDNVDLETVWVLYWFGGGRSMELPLGRGETDEWGATITIPHALTALHYFIGARDFSGNMNWSAQEDRLVMDNDAPEVVRDASYSVATTGDPFVFDFRVEDNICVADVLVVYWLPDGEHLEPPLISNFNSVRRNGTHRATVDIPSNATGPLVYVIIASDDSGNMLTTDERYIEVLDNDPPWFGNDLSDEEAWRGESFHFDIEVWDNFDVDELRCAWWYGDGQRINESVPLDSPLAILVPLDTEGPLYFRFAARDASGNWKNIGRFDRTVNNRPPALTGLEMWNVTEEELEMLDLLEFIDDRDDTAWVVAVDSPDANLTLDAYSLSVMHDIWVPDYVIEVSISDGRDTSRHNITVHIIGVNDAPQVLEVRRNEEIFDILNEVASFRKGRMVSLTVLATDEEGDAIYYSWQKDGVEVATGPVLRGGNLPLGAYDLMLNVSDGTDTTSYVVMVSVTEDEQLFTPRIWAVLVLAFVVVVGVVLYVRRSGPDRD